MYAAGRKRENIESSFILSTFLRVSLIRISYYRQGEKYLFFSRYDLYFINKIHEVEIVISSVRRNI